MKPHLIKIKDLLRPSYYFCKDVLDFSGRATLSKNIVLKNKFNNKRAFLLLTGESLQQIDIQKLRNEYTFGVGFIFLHTDIQKVNLTYYMNTEPAASFHPNNTNWPEHQLGPLGKEGISLFYRQIDKRLDDSTTLILNSDNHKYITGNNFFKNKTKYFVKTKKVLPLTSKYLMRSLQI